MEKKIINKHVSFWVEDNSVLLCKISNLNPDQKLDYKIAQECLAVVSELNTGVPMPIIIDLRDVKGTFSIAAGHLLSKKIESMSLISTEVYLVNSLSINLLIKSYKRLYSKKLPHAIFKSMKLAKVYCLNYQS
tara:strand:- start:1397 stop:1795 length:399 start_codon:yes stop_codon:yes gene_type:complete